MAYFVTKIDGISLMVYMRYALLALLLAIAPTNLFAELTTPSRPLHVSMIWLLTDPEGYANKNIVVQGYLSLQKEDARLYFNCSSYRHFEQVNSISIQLDTRNFLRFQDYQGSYVQVVGIFNPYANYKHNIMHGGPAGVIIVDTYKSVADIQLIRPRGGKKQADWCKRRNYQSY